MTKPRAATSHVVRVAPSDVIAQVHQELVESQVRREAAGLLPLFEVESLEIEMQVTLSTVESAGGRVDVKLFAVTSDVQVDASQTHTIRLKLRGIDGSEEPARGRGSTGLRPRTQRPRQ
jgi:hypothetical protein